MTVARFPATVLTDQAALNAAADTANLMAICTPFQITVANTSGAPGILTPQQFINGLLRVTTAITPFIAPPTAAQIVAYINAGPSMVATGGVGITGTSAVPATNSCQGTTQTTTGGTTFKLAIINIGGSGPITWIMTGTNITTYPATLATIAPNSGMDYRCWVTNAAAGSEAVSMQQLSFAST